MSAACGIITSHRAKAARLRSMRGRPADAGHARNSCLIVRFRPVQRENICKHSNSPLEHVRANSVTLDRERR
jgi:hypothetical protein